MGEPLLVTIQQRGRHRKAYRKQIYKLKHQKRDGSQFFRSFLQSVDIRPFTVYSRAVGQTGRCHFQSCQGQRCRLHQDQLFVAWRVPAGLLFVDVHRPCYRQCREGLVLPCQLRHVLKTPRKGASAIKAFHSLCLFAFIRHLY